MAVSKATPRPGGDSPPPRARASSRAPAPTTRARSGLGTTDDSAPFVEVWSDADHARATGLVQILDEHGHADPARVPALTPAEMIRLYEGMLRVRLLDERLLPMQRQGRIGFYIEARGQEAGLVGGAHALLPEDYFVPGLRETGAALYRGYPLRAHLAQIFGNGNDLAHGHQLSCHGGSRASHHIVMSSCVSSQLPHAVGIAHAAKIRGDKVVALGFLGDGGTSTEDFHVALNFAGVYKVPVVFVCQNNQWAISTPLALQTASETIAIKGLAYGVPSVRVDGNDIFAVYAEIKAAVDRARAGGGPAFIECLTYRLGPHSSSDDPSRYRDEAEANAWKTKEPLSRLRTYLAKAGILDAAAANAMADDIGRAISEAIALEEGAAPPERATLIQDVFAHPTWLLDEQFADLERVRRTRG